MPALQLPAYIPVDPHTDEPNEFVSIECATVAHLAHLDGKIDELRWEHDQLTQLLLAARERGAGDSDPALEG